jgi:hypothetical protein
MYFTDFGYIGLINGSPSGAGENDSTPAHLSPIQIGHLSAFAPTAARVPSPTLAAIYR